MADRTPRCHSGQAQRDPESMLAPAPSLQMDTGLRRYDELRYSDPTTPNCHPGLDPGSMPAVIAVVDTMSGYLIKSGMTVSNFRSVN